MNLIDIAENDLSFTMEDSINGFGVPLILYDLNDNLYFVTMQTTDIGFFIDLQSGTSIQGRQVEVNGRISTIEAIANKVPAKGWKCDFVDTAEKTWSMIVAKTPTVDRKMGVYQMTLEAYNKNANV